MKHLLIATAFLLSSIIGFAQCTPNAPTGNPGVFPPPDSIPCIERGVAYDFTMQLENYDTFSASFPIVGNIGVPVNWTRIDSLTNFPCGITWQANQLQFTSGETGCIRVSGTSSEIPGQYPLNIYLTMNITLPVLGDTSFSGEITDLIAQLENLTGQSLGLDVAYVSRVIQPGANCPARDVNSTGVSSGAVCPPLSVVITGVTSICAGASTTLTAVAQFELGTVDYVWSTGDTTAAITVNTTDTYTVTVDDGSNTATASVSVNTGSAPASAFTATENGADVTFSNTTSNATSYAWDFGDGTSSTLQSPPVKTYTANGTFTITLIATNSCGSDTTTQDVTITGVFINSVEYDLNFDVFPNPSTGNISLNFSADNAMNYDLKIFDLSGKNVFAEKIIATGSVQKQLDLSALPKGVYTLHLSSDNGFGVKKLQLN